MITIMVLSGKGGVGKSTVSCGLAQALAHRGHHVGLLDCDLENPCLPTLASAGRPEIGEEGRLLPAEANGLKVFSIGASMDADLPVLVGDEMKAGLVRDMVSFIDWGGLDFLVVDTPPGSGIEVKTVVTSQIGDLVAIVVTQPSQVSYQAVRRTFGLLEKYGVKVLGVVENMAGADWGNGAGDRLANLCNTRVLAKVPFDPRLRQQGDRGEELPVELFEELVQEVMGCLQP